MVILLSLGLTFLVCKIREELISLTILYFLRIMKKTQVRGSLGRCRKFRDYYYSIIHAANIN